MVGRVINFCNENQASWKSISVFAKTYQQLLDNAEVGLGLLKAKEGIATEGFTTAKDLKFKAMKSAGYILSKRLASFARDNEEWVLLSLVLYSESGFSKGSEKEVMNRCMVVADQGDKFANRAGDFKVNAEVIANLRKLINEYKGMPEQRDNVRSAKKITGQDIRDDIKRIRAILDNLDDKVEGLIDDKNFRDRYFEARAIVDHGSRNSGKNGDKPQK
jgi:hypothetical protein